MIEEHGIDDLARRRWQAEADGLLTPRMVLHFGKRGLDQPHALRCFDGAADVVLVTRGAREHERVENDVFLGDATADAVIAGALGDGEFAFARDGLRLLLVSSIDPMTMGRAEFLHQRQHLVEFFLAILEVDRVDDAFAQAIGSAPARPTGMVESIMNGTLTL